MGGAPLGKGFLRYYTKRPALGHAPGELGGKITMLDIKGEGSPITAPQMVE
jgi:hypothetical protein